MIKHGLLLIIGWLYALTLLAQSGSGSCVKSTEGKEFWFGFMENRLGFSCLLPVPENYTEVTVVSRFNCQFTITIGNEASPVVSDVLVPNVPKKYKLDRSKVEPFGSEMVEAKGIHLVSTAPLNLYTMNYGYNSADAAVIFPVEALGNEYYTMCYEPHYELRYNSFCGFFTNGKNSEFVLVAAEDQTQVSITPSKVTDKLQPANQSFTITLNKGELYQVQSANLPNMPGQGDLTGSYITSNKPIACYSGAWATSIPNTSTDAWDHLYEQIPPVNAWGRKFITVPLKSRAKDTYRILASADQTTVRILNKETFVLDKGEFREFMLNADEATMIDSDHPILLAEYSNSNDVDRPPSIPQGGAWDGDPSMMIVSPVDQTREQVTFVAYDLPEINQKFFVNIVTQSNAVNQILLDGGKIDFQVIPNTNYAYAQVQINAGNHELASTESGKGFIAYVYGFGGVESYGYGVGFNLSTKLDLGGDIQFARDTILLCEGERRTLDAGAHFATYLWNTGATTQKIEVSAKGNYRVTATTSDGCVLSDDIEVVENQNLVNLGTSAVICLPGTLTLDAGDFTSYKWTTNETSRKIVVENPGQYGVEVINQYGCKSSASVVATTANRPRLITNLLDTLICGSKSSTVNLSANSGIYTLSSSNPAVSITGLTATVPDYGYYLLSFQTKDQNSCSADTSFTLHFRKSTIPAIVVDNSCAGYSLDAGYQGDAQVSSSHFIWILAGDTLAIGWGKDHIHKELGAKSQNTNLLLQIIESGCQMQQASLPLTLVPDLDFAVGDSALCLAEPLDITATHSRDIASWLWDWGDGQTESFADRGSHTYTREGIYSIGLTAITDKGCKNTILKKNLVNVAPVPTVGFSIPDNHCFDDGIQSINYSGDADKSAFYQWDLSGFQPGEIISNPGSSSGPLRFQFKSQPQARISLQVISKYQCKSELKEIMLKRKPIFSFQSPVLEGCEPLAANFQVATSEQPDELSFDWNFGDGTSGKGTEIDHTFYGSNNTYDLKLTATSAITGCTDSIRKSKLVTVWPTPQARFVVDQQVFLSENPSVAITNQTTGASNYRWDFGDGTGSIEKDPQHQYFVTGRREIVLEASNDYGCMDTAQINVSIALARIYAPNAFAPNAINEIDREFKPYTKDVVPEGYHLKILSRWNDILFECRDEIAGWNGRTSKGDLAPSGTYIWILEYNDFLGKPHRQRGTVVLIN